MAPNASVHFDGWHVADLEALTGTTHIMQSRDALFLPNPNGECIIIRARQWLTKHEDGSFSVSDTAPLT